MNCSKKTMKTDLTLNLNDFLNQAISAETDEQRAQIIADAQQTLQTYLNENPELFKVRFAELLTQIEQGLKDLKEKVYQQDLPPQI
jgi:hypothetical protein